MKYKVTVRREEYREHVFEVEAGNREGAEDAALEMSQEHDFDENPVHYADEEVTSVVQVDEAGQDTGAEREKIPGTMLERIAFILSDILNVEKEKITLESKLVEDLGADSLDEVEIVMAIEDEFEIEIHDGEYAGVTTVAEIMKIVEGKITNGKDGKE